MAALIFSACSEKLGTHAQYPEDLELPEGLSTETVTYKDGLVHIDGYYAGTEPQLIDYFDRQFASLGFEGGTASKTEHLSAHDYRSPEGEDVEVFIVTVYKQPAQRLKTRITYLDSGAAQESSAD